jgi:hypothetical protein
MALPRPVLVVGSMRSGTTLLNRMLDAHPQVAMIYHPTRFFESTRGLRDDAGVGGFLDAFRGQYGFFGRLGADVQARCEEALGMLPAAASKGEIYRALTRSLVDKRGADLVGEKYAGRGAELLPFRTLLPDGKMIMVVRDPRDVLLSNKKRVEQEADMENYWAGAHLMVVDDWSALAVLHRSLDQIQGGAYLQVRYEDLVGEPEPTARRICTFLGVPFAPEMIASGALRHEDGRPWKANTSHGKPYEGLSGESVGRYQEGLSAGEILFLNALLADHLGFFRYAPDPVRMELDALSEACHLFLKLGRMLKRYGVTDGRLYNVEASEDENLAWFVDKLVALGGLEGSDFVKGFLVGRATTMKGAADTGRTIADEIVALRRSFEYLPAALDAFATEVRTVRAAIDRFPSVLNVVKRAVRKPPS